MAEDIKVVDISPSGDGIIVEQAFLSPVEIGAFPNSVLLSKRPVVSITEVRAGDTVLVPNTDFIFVRDVATEFASSSFSIDRVIFTDSARDKITSGSSIRVTYTFDARIGAIQRLFSGSRDDTLSTNAPALASVRVRKALPVEVAVAVKVSGVLPSATDTILNNTARRELAATILSQQVFVPKLNLTITPSDIINAIAIADPNVLIAPSGVTFSVKMPNHITFSSQSPGQSLILNESRFPLLAFLEVTK